MACRPCSAFSGKIMSDTIEIKGLRVSTHIGVPDAERGEPQELFVDLTLHPRRGFDTLSDRIEGTVDYHAVAIRVDALAAERERQLIETFAEEIATTILREFAVTRIEVGIRKFILPQTEWVGVRCVRERTS